MKHRLFIKIITIILLLSAVMSFTACKEIPSEPVTGSETAQGEETDTAGADTGKQTDQKTESSDTSVSDPETEQTGTSAKQTDTERKTETDTKRDTDTNSEKSTKTSETSTATSSKTSKNTASSSVKTTQSDTVDSAAGSVDTPVQSVYTDIAPIDPEDYYGRVWLSTRTNGKKLVKTYVELVAGIGNIRATIPLSAGITVDELYTVWNCFRADYPQFFWLESQYTYYYSGKKATSITPNYTMTKKEILEARSEFDRAAREILSGIHSGMSQYDIEKTIHDRLILTFVYNEGANAHNAYGALVDGAAVCEGISKAFQHLCRSVGIDALFIFGKSNNPSSGSTENHSWNIVKIDGDYYHVDVTWDNSGEPVEGRIHYAWFNLPTEWITEDHTLIQEGYAYPSCTTDGANYFRTVNGKISELTVRDILERTVKQGNEFFFQAYMLNESDAHGWVKENAGTLAKEYGLNGYQYNVFTTGREICLVMKSYGG